MINVESSRALIELADTCAEQKRAIGRLRDAIEKDAGDVPFLAHRVNEHGTKIKALTALVRSVYRGREA